jgi:hypothetical protein
MCVRGARTEACSSKGVSQGSTSCSAPSVRHALQTPASCSPARGGSCQAGPATLTHHGKAVGVGDAGGEEDLKVKAGRQRCRLQQLLRRCRRLICPAAAAGRSFKAQRL